MMCVQWFLLCVLLAVSCRTSAGAKILYMQVTPSPSHHIWDKTIAMALLERGHQITYVTASKEKDSENMTYIYLEDVYKKLYTEFDYGDLHINGPYENTLFVYEWFEAVCKLSYKTDGIKRLLKQAQDGVKYDLIIIDATTGQCFYPFIEKFGSPPTVATSPFGVQYYHLFSFGVNTDSSYVPLYMLPYTDEMTFFQRMNNYVFTAMSVFWHKYFYMPKMWKLAEELFGPGVPPLDEYERNFSFLIANFDPILDHPRSLPPAVIPAGGLHVKRKATLTKDLKQIMDDAKDGVILFSLGSNLRSDLLDISKRNILINAFAQLKQTVLWKFESELKDLPKNVIIRPWLAQNDILSHPNFKLFISHGGGLSTKEAMYHGVPVVGIPFIADQHVNMNKLTIRKVALTLDFNTLTSEKIVAAVNEILNNPVYKKNMMKISQRFRDQPQNPLDRSVFWIEYALKHGGAQHLRVAPRDMPLYKVLYLDIWAFFIVIIILSVSITVKLYRLLFQSSKSTKLKKN